MTVTLTVPISAIEHFAYCPRQCALIHVDGVWADNEHTVRGVRAHRRVDAGGSRLERGRRVLRGIPLWSESLGLSGRADVVEVEEERVYPVEYKAGTRHGNAADLQLCAQAMCLEEMFDVAVEHGYVWYGGPRRRDRVEFTPGLRTQVQEIVVEIRDRMRTGLLPRAPNDQRCPPCQLLNYCLPELTDDPDRVVRYMERIVFECAT